VYSATHAATEATWRMCAGERMRSSSERHGGEHPPQLGREGPTGPQALGLSRSRVPRPSFSLGLATAGTRLEEPGWSRYDRGLNTSGTQI
jgi:hypothetical protein